jgi:hypothetical protein
MHSRLGAAIALGNLHTGVYEGSVSDLPMDHLKRWSVKYVLLSPSKSMFGSKLAAAGFEERTIRDGWSMWEHPQALPRIRWEGASSYDQAQRGVQWNEHVNSIEVNLTQWQTSRLELAFAANPDLQVCLENACNPIPSSSDGLIHIDVPPGTRRVRIVYRNGLFFPSICIALLTLAVLSAYALRMRGRMHRMSVESECVPS